MHKTQGTRRRQWPPSREEILCTVNRRPIYARFHLMDGQYHAVEFHASATAREVLACIQTKIGLRENALGTSLQLNNISKDNISRKIYKIFKKNYIFRICHI